MNINIKINYYFINIKNKMRNLKIALIFNNNFFKNSEIGNIMKFSFLKKCKINLK